MIISPLFFLLVFSLAIFEKGLNRFDLDIVNALGYIAIAYFIPVLILEILIKRYLRKRIDDKKIYLAIFLRSLMVAFLAIFSWSYATDWFYRPQGEEAAFMFLVIPIVFAESLILNFVLAIIIFQISKKKEGQLHRKITIVILLISFILLGYGGSMLAKCDGNGCGNKEYLVERAIKENNPSVCLLANRTEHSSLPTSFLVPTNFYAISISDCYFSLAIESNKLELCDLAGYEKGTCYKTFAERLSDASICDKIPDSDNEKRDCFINTQQTEKTYFNNN